MEGLLTSVASHLVQLDIRLAFMVFREAAWSRRCSWLVFRGEISVKRGTHARDHPGSRFSRLVQTG